MTNISNKQGQKGMGKTKKTTKISIEDETTVKVVSGKKSSNTSNKSSASSTSSAAKKTTDAKTTTKSTTAKSTDKAAEVKTTTKDSLAEKTTQPETPEKSSTKAESSKSTTKAEPSKTSSESTSAKSTKTSTSTALAKTGPRTIMKTSKSRKKKPLPKVTIQDAEIVENADKTSETSSKSTSKSTTKSSASAKTTTKSTKPKTTRVIKVEDGKSSTSKSTKATETNKSKTKENMKLPLLRRLHFKIQYIVLSVLAIVAAAFFIRVAVWEHNYLLAMEGSERDVVIQEQVYEGGEEVDETEPTEEEIIEYHVAPNRPRYLTIPSLGLYNIRIVEIGLKDNGALDVPYNIYNVGWYNGSVLPGQEGVSVMDAHGGDLGYGIFRSLPKIQLNQDIIIEMGDEVTKYTYTVTDIAFQPLGDEADEYMKTTAFRTPIGTNSSLTLITCTGDWLLTRQTYSKRLFVRASLKQ